MDMTEREISKVFIQVPERPGRTRLEVLAHAVKGMILAPFYWILASFSSVPGLRFRFMSLGLGFKALLTGGLPLYAIFHLFFMPMDSTRYFEFEFAWKALAGRSMRRYLDVSSPRLLPILLTKSRPALVADLINPHPADLRETQLFVDLIRVGTRCKLHGCLIAEAPFDVETFDVITSISVLEHIPDDVSAVRRIWTLLKPGGVLILTVPCMARASEQYIDRDQWGLLGKDGDGYVFWQRFYDWSQLEQKIFPITGRPETVSVFGEKQAGSLFANETRKRADPDYPYWREPYMMATEYRYFDAPDELPGDGVIGLVFRK